MSIRVQVILEESEQEAIRREARRQGVSLSAWMRRAAQERLQRQAEAQDLATEQDLQAFFAACDERETGVEPDWDEHRSVIDSSRGSGTSGT